MALRRDGGPAHRPAGGLIFPVAFYAVLLDRLMAAGWLDKVL